MMIPFPGHSRYAAPALLCLGLIVFPSGCGGAGSTLYPVQGTVKVDAKPLPRGSVAFHPDAKKGNESKKILGGDIVDGAYKIYTDGQPGAPPGWYKVTVVSTSEVDSAKPEAVKSYVHQLFSDPKTTTLSVEVTASPKAGAYDLTVGSPK
jgi:hypothetical protein